MAWHAVHQFLACAAVLARSFSAQNFERAGGLPARQGHACAHARARAERQCLGGIQLQSLSAVLPIGDPSGARESGFQPSVAHAANAESPAARGRVTRADGLLPVLGAVAQAHKVHVCACGPRVRRAHLPQQEGYLQQDGTAARAAYGIARRSHADKARRAISGTAVSTSGAEFFLGRVFRKACRASEARRVQCLKGELWPSLVRCKSGRR